MTSVPYRRLLTPAFLVAVMGMTACSSGGEAGSSTQAVPDSARVESNELVLVASTDPGTLDYVTSNLTALAWWIPGNVMEPLLIADQDGNIGPGIASDWSVSDDQTVYTFDIRDANYSTGEQVTAEDVVYSLEQMRDSTVPNNRTPFNAVDKIQKVDEDTIEVELSEPSFSFLEGMADTAGIVQPQAAEGQRATAPIGTGPYKVEEYSPDSHLTLTVNEEYWGESPAIDKVTVRFIPDPTAALNAIASGEVDGYPYIPEDQWDKVVTQNLDKSYARVDWAEGGNVYFLNFNTTAEPYSDVEFRRALVKAIDREAYVSAFNTPWGLTPTCGYADADSASMDECLDPYDPEKASAELDALGYGETPIEFTSTNLGNLIVPSDLAVAQLQGADVNVERNALDFARYSEIVFGGSPPQYGLTIMTTPLDMIQMGTCTDPAKAGWKTYCSEDMNALLKEADSAPDEEARQEALDAAQMQMQKDAVIVPVMAAKNVALLHPDLDGWLAPHLGIAVNLSSLTWSGE